MKANEIELNQVDSQLAVTINGQDMCGLFSGYNIIHTSDRESEVWLRVKGTCTISVLSAKTES